MRSINNLIDHRLFLRCEKQLYSSKGVKKKIRVIVLGSIWLRIEGPISNLICDEIVLGVNNEKY